MVINYKLPNWIDRYKASIVLKALFLNIVYLIGMLLFFKPFLSADDCFMSQTVYGVFGDDYDYHITYENFLYGRFIVFLMRLFPSIPWYTILFYVWIFIALTLLTYMILKWSNNYAGLLVSNIILIFFSYEGYIAIQFTKIAGIIGAIGFMAMLSQKASWKIKLTGAGLWILSCMVRVDCAKMVCGAGCCAFLFTAVVTFFKNRKFELKSYRKVGIWLLIGLSMIAIVPSLQRWVRTDEEKEFWSLYWEHDSIRSSMQDYTVPDYEENKELYDLIEISKNDLYILSSWNWDCDVVTLEKGAIIQALQKNDNAELTSLLDSYKSKNTEIQDIGTGENENDKNFIISIKTNVFDYVKAGLSLLQKVFNVNSIAVFFKIFPKAFLNIDVCIAYFLILLIAPICWKIKKEDFFWAVTVSGAILLLLNYYMYINARYLQHRVDVGVVMVVIVIFLSLIMENETVLLNNVENKTRLFLIVPLLILAGKYFYYADDNQNVSDALIAKNKTFYEQTSQDDEHIYFLAGYGQMGKVPLLTFYGAFDVPKIGIMHNITQGRTLECLKSEENNYLAMINNNERYLVMGDYDGNQSAWQAYFTEHSGEKATLTLVKQYLEKKFYRVRTKPLHELVDLSEVEIGTGIIEDDLVCAVLNNNLTVSGTAYLKGESGFSQSAYIQIIDSETGNYELYDTFATCDNEKKYGDEGYFANISADIDLPDFYDEGDKIYLLIEQNGVIHDKRIE